MIRTAETFAMNAIRRFAALRGPEGHDRMAGPAGDGRIRLTRSEMQTLFSRELGYPARAG